MVCYDRHSRIWIRIGAGVSVLSALLTLVIILVQLKIRAEITPLGVSANHYEKLFLMLYALSLMVVPFALWYRIEEQARKWKARVCNVLTLSTTIFAILTYSILHLTQWLYGSVQAMYIPARYLFVSGTLGTIVSATLCMIFMGWSLWDGGFKKIGVGALLLATISLTPSNPIYGEFLRFFWLVWLAKWFIGHPLE